MENVYVLVHSPLVGPYTWQLVADELRQRGLETIVPRLIDSGTSSLPFWKQHAASVSRAIDRLSPDRRIIMVAHSGAGPLLPAIRQCVKNSIHAYVFVDAGIPRDGASRLELMKSEDPVWAENFRQELKRGVRYPMWQEADLRESVPDLEKRKNLLTELNPRGLSFFSESIPVFKGWPDAPCVYIRLSIAYDRVFNQAQDAGWLVYPMDAGHFHNLVDPKAVANVIISAVSQLSAE